MRHGLVIALSQDKRSSLRVLTGLLPASAAIQFVKDAITTGVAPDALHPHLQAIEVSHATVLRDHRFRPTAEQIAEAQKAAETAASGDELNAALAEIGALQSTVDELTAHRESAATSLAESAAALEAAQARIADLEAQLKAAADSDKSKKGK